MNDCVCMPGISVREPIEGMCWYTYQVQAHVASPGYLSLKAKVFLSAGEKKQETQACQEAEATAAANWCTRSGSPSARDI